MIFGIYGMHFHHIFIMNYIRNKLKKKKKKKKKKMIIIIIIIIIILNNKI